MSFSSEPALVVPPATPARTDGQAAAAAAPSGSPGNGASSPPPHPCGRPIDCHAPVGGAETGPLVAPLPVVPVAPGLSGGAVPDVNLDPTLGTPMLQEIAIKEWKEVRMGELFETNGLSAVLHAFAEKELIPLMTLGKDCPTGTCPCPQPCGRRLNHTPVAARSYRQACHLGDIYR